MASNCKQNSSLFIISEGQFYSKPSIKLDRLEKQYSALKAKDNEDQVTLRRLRTENRLLKQRIENLEQAETKLLQQKEEQATVIEKLVHDQIRWAKEVKQLRDLKTEVQVTQNQMKELQSKFLNAEEVIRDVCRKNQTCNDQIRRMGEDNLQLKKCLQEALDQEKNLQTIIKDLAVKLDDVENERKEEAILARLKNAENIHQIVELRRQLSKLDIQKNELLVSEQLRDEGCSPELENSSDDQAELHLSTTEQVIFTARHLSKMDGLCNSISDDELETEIIDSLTLTDTLSDILESSGNVINNPMKKESSGFKTILSYFEHENNKSPAPIVCCQDDQKDFVSQLRKVVSRENRNDTNIGYVNVGISGCDCPGECCAGYNNVNSTGYVNADAQQSCGTDTCCSCQK